MEEMNNKTIQLTGFQDVNEEHMAVISKQLHTYSERLESHQENIQELALRLKPIHQNEHNQINNVQGRLTINGTTYAVDVEDRNLLSAVDSVLTKLENATRN